MPLPGKYPGDAHVWNRQSLNSTPNESVRQLPAQKQHGENDTVRYAGGDDVD